MIKKYFQLYKIPRLRLKALHSPVYGDDASAQMMLEAYASQPESFYNATSKTAIASQLNNITIVQQSLERLVKSVSNNQDKQ
jgi:hypothetical protein